jgi:hypothetical protein
MATRLRQGRSGVAAGEPDPRSLAGAAAALVVSGLAFRTVARSLRSVLPEPLANAAVAGAATWVVGEAVRRLQEREGRIPTP